MSSVLYTGVTVQVRSSCDNGSFLGKKVERVVEMMCQISDTMKRKQNISKHHLLLGMSPCHSYSPSVSNKLHKGGLKRLFVEKTLLPTFGIYNFFSKQNKENSTNVPWIWETSCRDIVTFANAGTGMTDSSEMVQCMRSGGFPKPAYIDGWLVGQNLQNIHTIHTPSMRRTCKSSASLQSTPLLCTRIWTMVSFPTSRNVDQVLCQSRSEMKSSSRLFFKSSYHSLIWNLSKKSLIFSQESLSIATE